MSPKFGAASFRRDVTGKEQKTPMGILLQRGITGSILQRKP